MRDPDELDEQYRARLCRLVEREMNRRFRRKEDPEDVVQSAFRTFYRRNAQGEFHIDSSVDLWRLLETITRHKILKHVEKLGAGKRDPKREEYPEGDDLARARSHARRGRDSRRSDGKSAGRPGRDLRGGSPHAAAKLHRGRNRRQAGLHPFLRPHQVEPHSRAAAEIVGRRRREIEIRRFSLAKKGGNPASNKGRTSELVVPASAGIAGRDSV